MNIPQLRPSLTNVGKLGLPKGFRIISIPPKFLREYEEARSGSRIQTVPGAGADPFPKPPVPSRELKVAPFATNRLRRTYVNEWTEAATDGIAPRDLSVAGGRM